MSGFFVGLAKWLLRIDSIFLHHARVLVIIIVREKFMTLKKYAWGVLIYNVFVIMFGTFVRATGSGAGCGAHWPLCTGEVIPEFEAMTTRIEFTHRITSGIAFISVTVLLIWVLRTVAMSHPARKWAKWAMAFMVSESLVGALIVLMRWTGNDTSVGRAIFVALHMVNSLSLVACMTLTAFYLSRDLSEPALLSAKYLTWNRLAFTIGAIALVLISSSGAVTALGDTLFPKSDIGINYNDLSPAMHFLVQLRIVHPILSIVVGGYVALLNWWIRRQHSHPQLDRIATIYLMLFATQCVLGTFNIVLFAPIWLQIIHTLFANLVWITFIILIATLVVLTQREASKSAANTMPTTA